MLLRFVDDAAADLLAVDGFDADIPRAGRRVTVDPDGVTATVQRTDNPRASTTTWGRPGIDWPCRLGSAHR